LFDEPAKSKFAPKKDLSLEELMPNQHELEQLSGGGSINPETFAIRSEEAGRLREAFHKLPPQYRIVLVLRDMEGLSDKEVAEIAGLRTGTVRARLHRARLFVRERIDEDTEAAPRREDRSYPIANCGRQAVQISPRQGNVRRAFELPG
jgi:DNA-directed RNA polymerase specialized sigma24 family protein